MRGYPQFSFGIPRALAKFGFLRIVLNRAKKLVGTTHRKPEFSRDAQNVCTLTIVGTVLNYHYLKAAYSFVKAIFAGVPT